MRPVATGEDWPEDRPESRLDEDRLDEDWSPDRIQSVEDLLSAVRASRIRSGISYRGFEVKARRLAEAGELDAGGDRAFAANPLPRASLHRAIRYGEARWFADRPARLAALLRIAGCPERVIPRWLTALAAVAAEAGGADRAGGEALRPTTARPRRPGRWLGWLTLAGTLAGLVVGVFLVVWAGHRRFYAELGVSPSQAPVDLGGLVVSTFIATLVVAVVVLVLVMALLIGAALAPWAAPTRAARPAAALYLAVFAGGYALLLLVPGRYGVHVLAVLGAVVLASQYRLLTRQRPAYWLSGWVIGLAAVTAVTALGVGVGDWLGGRPLLVGVLLAVVLGLLWWWLRRELRREGLDPRGYVSPRALLDELVDELVWWRDAPRRTRKRGWEGAQASRILVALAVLLIALPVLLVVGVRGTLGSAADAAGMAREYGYVPRGQGLAIWPTREIRPARVVPHGEDRYRVCEDAAWSASLVGRDRDGAWVLLRPRATAGPRTAGSDPRTVRLPAGLYTVVPVFDPGLREGEPWSEPACP